MSLKKKVYIAFITVGIITLVVFLGFFILFACIGEFLRAILLICNSMALLSGIIVMLDYVKDMK